MKKVKFWKRHANPWSGWTRVASAPLYYIALWYQNWIFLIILLIWAAINPFIFPEPKRTDNWASKGVYGEQIWTKNVKFDISLILNILSGTCFIPSIFFALFQMFWPLLYTGTLGFLFKIWFVDRMVHLYEISEKIYEE